MFFSQIDTQPFHSRFLSLDLVVHLTFLPEDGDAGKRLHGYGLLEEVVFKTWHTFILIPLNFL